jgi:hypothetical protein
MRTALYNQMIAAGASETEAQNFIDTVLGTPDSVEVNYDTNATEAAQDAQGADWDVPDVTVWYNGNLTALQSVVDRDASRIRRPVIALQYRTGQTAV